MHPKKRLHAILIIVYAIILIAAILWVRNWVLSLPLILRIIAICLIIACIPLFVKKLIQRSAGK